MGKCERRIKRAKWLRKRRKSLQEIFSLKCLIKRFGKLLFFFCVTTIEKKQWLWYKRREENRKIGENEKYKRL